jgi:hypothetical protein
VGLLIRASRCSAFGKLTPWPISVEGIEAAR